MALDLGTRNVTTNAARPISSAASLSSLPRIAPNAAAVLAVRATTYFDFQRRTIRCSTRRLQFLTPDDANLYLNRAYVLESLGLAAAASRRPLHVRRARARTADRDEVRALGRLVAKTKFHPEREFARLRRRPDRAGTMRANRSSAARVAWNRASVPPPIG